DPAKCCGAGLQTCAGRPRTAVRDSATCKGRTRGPAQTWTSAPRKLSDIGLSGGSKHDKQAPIENVPVREWPFVVPRPRGCVCLEEKLLKNRRGSPRSLTAFALIS